MPQLDVKLLTDNGDGTVLVQVPGGEQVTVPTEFLRYTDLEAFSPDRPQVKSRDMDFTVGRRMKARYRGSCLSCTDEIQPGRVMYTADQGMRTGYVCRTCGEVAIRTPR